ncbi:MAG: flagellar biosynthetic protein FliP [Ilumatobacteraceae bacterium]|nr:flagellar biosynthetic protein FliP [Ilumatobacteraceae bacterium]
MSAAADAARSTTQAVAPSANTPTPPNPIDSIPPIDVPTIGDVPAQLPDGGSISTPASMPSTGSSSGSGSNANINLSLPGSGSKDSSNSVVIILLLTVVSVAPSLLVLCTSFTRIVIVLSLTRNALGIPSIPPQQVIVGLSVFLTLFVMGPTLGQMKTEALDPLLAGKITTSEALVKAETPLRTFLLKHTREDELGLFLDASKTATPVAREKVPMNALIPAFVLSELKSSFIIGFVIFIPFLIIDLVVSAVLMGLGMMMLPPSFVSLPFKLLLFVMLDGWMLIVGMLLTSYK